MVEITRTIVAGVLSLGLAFHGKRKGSLRMSGALAAVIVGFVSFATSYRMGTILIVFYYTGSKITKVREDQKVKWEYNLKAGGQRGAMQVLANSFLATMIAVLFYYIIGEDEHPVEFGLGQGIRMLMNHGGMTKEALKGFQKQLSSYLWVMYVAHYACANGDTWASELGILSKSNPRLITSFLTKEVPKGTNGGVSLEGTLASALGGGLIGLVFWLMSFFMASSRPLADIAPQYPMVIVGLAAGVIGSIVDSILGATVQATYYNSERKQIVKGEDFRADDKDVEIIQGVNFLSNESVNFFSIAITMCIICGMAPSIFALAY